MTRSWLDTSPPQSKLFRPWYNQLLIKHTNVWWQTSTTVGESLVYIVCYLTPCGALKKFKRHKEFYLMRSSVLTQHITMQWDVLECSQYTHRMTSLDHASYCEPALTRPPLTLRCFSVCFPKCYDLHVIYTGLGWRRAPSNHISLATTSADRWWVAEHWDKTLVA